MITSKTAAIGNDIVDLNDPDARGAIDNSRFINRVFTTREKQNIFESPSPEKTLWSLWAAKEAFYKVLAGLNPGQKFSPIQIETSENFVTYKTKRMKVKNIGTDDFVLSVCSGPGNAHFWYASRQEVLNLPSFDTYFQKTVSYSEQSRICHAYTIWLLENELDIQEVTIQKDARSPRFAPKVFSKQKPLNRASLSLSHHGRYFSVAFLKAPGL